MLNNGNYPQYLKNRISGPYGHLSNDGAFELRKTIMSKELRMVYLTHLSKENNDPKVAYDTVHGALNRLNDGRQNNRHVPEIRIAKQDEVTEPYDV